MVTYDRHRHACNRANNDDPGGRFTSTGPFQERSEALQIVRVCRHAYFSGIKGNSQSSEIENAPDIQIQHLRDGPVGGRLERTSPCRGSIRDQNVYTFF